MMKNEAKNNVSFLYVFGFVYLFGMFREMFWSFMSFFSNGELHALISFSYCKLLFFSFVSLCQAITSSGTKKGEVFLADVNTQLKNKNITTDVRVDTNSNVSLNI